MWYTFSSQTREVLMKSKKTYFTTGEFAKIFDVKKQTLFHYDSCGIFKPDIIGENGYRYYSFTQLETFAIIRTLRDLGVHINEIKEHMDNRSPEALIELLESKKKEIDQKIESLKWSRIYINKKIEETRSGILAPVDEIIFENAEDQFYVITDYEGIDDEKNIMEAVGEHFAFCQRMNLYSAYPIGALIPRDSVSEDAYKYSQFYSVIEPSEISKHQSEELTLVKGGRLLAIYDNHGYANVLENCKKLIDYAAKNSLTLGDKFYEDVILDDLSTEGYYNYLVKLSIHVDG